MKIFTLLLVTTGACSLPACASDPKPPPVAAQAPAAAKKLTPASGYRATEPTRGRDDGSRGTVSISDAIRKACGLDIVESYFAYDSARIEGRTRVVLKKLAQCFGTGPMAGRGMRLVGHADPRGEDEYNLLLGGRRAESVKRTLIDFGMNPGQIETTSRGAFEAKGHDEETWQQDRRVDVLEG